MDKNAKNNQFKIEVVPALLVGLICAIVALSVLTFYQVVQVHNLSVIQRSALYRVLYFAQQELMSKIDEIPYRKNAEFIQVNDIDSAVYKASFDDEEANKLCFDKDGNSFQTEDDSLCEIKLSYYRTHEVDRNFQESDKNFGNDAHNLPISRVFFRARFSDGKTGEERVFYFSRVRAELAKF